MSTFPNTIFDLQFGDVFRFKRAGANETLYIALPFDASILRISLSFVNNFVPFSKNGPPYIGSLDGFLLSDLRCLERSDSTQIEIQSQIPFMPRHAELHILRYIRANVENQFFGAEDW